MGKESSLPLKLPDGGTERYFARANLLPIPPKLLNELTPAEAHGRRNCLRALFDGKGRLAYIEAYNEGKLFSRCGYKYDDAGRVIESTQWLAGARRLSIVEYAYTDGKLRILRSRIEEWSDEHDTTVPNSKRKG